MQTAMETRGFPVWVAFCTAVAVAVASGITVDDSVPARVGAGLVGLVGGLVLAFALASVLPARSDEPRPAAAPAGPDPVEAPTAVVPVDDRRARLEAQLAAADPEGDVEGWIASTQMLLDDVFPGAGGYFAALRSRSYPDERSRLEAHRARLETIVRDFL